MSQDLHMRHIDYLRVSVTDKCNFRCVYCMPEKGIELKNHREILRLEEFLHIIALGVEMGINKVRITGGEPLVRKGIVGFIKKINQIPGIKDIALTTNGALLGQMAGQLKEAGLNRVNISLDTLNADRFRSITRVGHLPTVLKSIDTALATGFRPVKINVVVIKDFNYDEVLDFVALTKDKPIHVRFIELMPIGETDKWEEDKYVPSEQILNTIKERYQVISSTGVPGAGPAKYMSVMGHQGSVGFISALSNHFCHQCNRLRLTAEGKLRPCLHGSKEVDLKTPLRSGASDIELKEIIMQAIKIKPFRHSMGEKGWENAKKMMYQIGG